MGRPASSNSRRIAPIFRRTADWLVTLPVCAAGAVFYPVLWYPFVYEEFIHFYDLVNFGPATLLLTAHAGHLALFSNLIYLPFYSLFGIVPMPYYGLALATHVLNVALLYRVVLRFTDRAFVALVGAALWGCTGVNLGAIGWFDVYGQLVVALILLLLIDDLARIANRGELPTRSRVVGWAVLLVVAVGSFGYGLSIAALFLPIATYILRINSRWQTLLTLVMTCIGIVALLYVTGQYFSAMMGRAVFYPLGQSYGMESFSWNNALRFIRALLAAVGDGLVNLFSGSWFHVEHGAVVGGPLSSLARPTVEVCLYVTAVAWIALCAYSFRLASASDRRRGLGLAVLAFACYATVAARIAGAQEDLPPEFLAMLANQGLDTSAWTPVCLVTVPRYQYVPSLLLLLVTIIALRHFPVRLPFVRGTLYLVAALWTSCSVWRNAAAVQAHHPPWHPQAIVERRLHESVGRFPPGAAVYIDNRPAIAMARLDDVLPGQAAIALLLFPDSVIEGRRIYFVVHDPALLARLRAATDTPMANLVVSPDEIPRNANYVRAPGSHRR